MADQWTVYLRAPNLSREGQISDYQTLECVERFNDVGTWSLDIDMHTRHARALITPGYGIEVVRDDGQVIMSGPLDTRKRKKSLTENRMTVAGFDDNIWLRRRQAHPQPGSSAPPYSTTEYDVRTGTASTVLRAYADVNLCSGAVMPRRVTGAALDVDPLVGTSVTGRARWQPLLELLQELALAGDGIGFRLRKSGTALLFTTYQPVDKTATVTFSEELGNLVEYDYDSAGPASTYLYVGGGGEGTARTIREQASDESVDWGRIEKFVDRRDTTDSTELEQEITKTQEEDVSKVGLSITPIDTPQQKYRTHYDLGDKVTVMIDGESVQELVREVKTVLTPNGPQKVLPTIGTVSRRGVLKLFDRLRSQQSRINNLERR